MLDDVLKIGYHRRGLKIVLVVVLVAALAGTVLSLQLTTLATEQEELFDSQTAATDFDITDFDADAKGENRVDVALELTNRDTADHQGNVTVYLYNASDVELVNETKATGVVAGGGTFSDTWRFRQANLAVEWDSTFVNVDQSS